MIQVVAYIGKLMIHPMPISSLEEIFVRATIGPVPGQIVLLAGLVFHSTWLAIAFYTSRSRRGADRVRPPRPPRDRILQLARGAE
jgi:hypothetical protein